MTGEQDLDQVAEGVRQQGYIDLLRDDPVKDWREQVVEPVIEQLRAAGWTVTAP